MTTPSKRTIISRQATAIHKRRRLAETEAEGVFPDEVENEGQAEEDDEAEEDDGNREATHKSLETYISTFQVHNGADSDPELGAVLLPEIHPQTGQHTWPRVSRPKRVELLKAAFEDMKKLLSSARKCPAGQDHTRHLQVKTFICVQLAHNGLGGRFAKRYKERVYKNLRRVSQRQPDAGADLVGAAETGAAGTVTAAAAAAGEA
ncbi:hypothetical protein FN846DRAFT_906128 [Sphaerosporella brunnea]|uniref:Uncharacterized protein n=1 Tax=Sphaerosporella brunnea TaxID=1250544 RepID=A0A5J5EZU8_9PEZI|nr:hypothetical protein FN846DRAFT_906128 [Sphaerosporella brunnea]